MNGFIKLSSHILTINKFRFNAFVGLNFINFHNDFVTLILTINKEIISFPEETSN